MMKTTSGINAPRGLSNLTGNTRRVCEHAANGSSKTGLSRREILSQYGNRRKIEDAIEKARSAGHPLRKVARVTRKPSVAGFHVVGMGLVPQLSLGELKVKLGAAGYTDMLPVNFGGHIKNIFTGRTVKIKEFRQR